MSEDEAINGMNFADLYGVPVFEMGVQIPKNVYQTFPTKDLPPSLAAHVEKLKKNNPNWAHHLFDDREINRFVSEHYGDQMVKWLDKIRPEYGAARADLFRYLLMYRMGGVYLDIKSGFDRPIDAAISREETFLISQWNNNINNRNTFGVHSELAHVPGGEYQNWQITTVPGHPYLRAVIGQVVHNIERYNPFRHGTGGRGVYRLTGPIAYTLAIESIRDRYPHRIVREDQVGLVYNATASSHKPMFKNHYLMRTDPIVRQEGVMRIGGIVYSASRKIKRTLYK